MVDKAWTLKKTMSKKMSMDRQDLFGFSDHLRLRLGEAYVQQWLIIIIMSRAFCVWLIRGSTTTIPISAAKQCIVGHVPDVRDLRGNIFYRRWLPLNIRWAINAYEWTHKIHVAYCLPSSSVRRHLRPLMTN